MADIEMRSSYQIEADREKLYAKQAEAQSNLETILNTYSDYKRKVIEHKRQAGLLEEEKQDFIDKIRKAKFIIAEYTEQIRQETARFWQQRRQNL